MEVVVSSVHGLKPEAEAVDGGWRVEFFEENASTAIRALCQRCHMLHDRPHHLAQRWITYRRRFAVGDLFLGPYLTLIRLGRAGPLTEHPR